MKRSVFARRNALISARTSVAGVALLVVVALTLIVRVAFPGLIGGVFRPLAYISDAALVGVASAGAVVTGPAKIQSDLDGARAYAGELEVQNQVLAARVKDLETLLGGRLEPSKGIVAGVIARPPQSPYDALVIDQGSDAGVGVGAQVLGKGGVPMGKVASVTAWTARVALYSAPGAITEGWVGEARNPITLTGEGGGAFSATAPHEVVIAVGDLIYVPGPGSLPLGRVLRIDTDPADPFVTIRIQPLANPFTLTWTTVLPVTAPL